MLRIIFIFLFCFNFFYCSHKNVKIPVIQMMPINQLFESSNQYQAKNFNLEIPEDWNYKFPKDNENTVIQFENSNEKIKGYLHKMEPGSKNFYSSFKNYIEEKQLDEIQWIKNTQKNGMEIYYIKGTYTIVDDILEEDVNIFNCFFGLYKLNNIIYEIMLIGYGDNLNYDDEGSRILNSFSINNNKQSNFKRFNINIPYYSNWELLSCNETEIVHYNHLKENIKLKIRYLGDKTDNETIEKEIDQFRLLFLKMEIDYDFEIVKEKIINDSVESTVFIAIAKWKRNKIYIRKYLFSLNGKLYSLEVFYQNKGWDEGIGKEVYKILNYIQ